MKKLNNIKNKFIYLYNGIDGVLTLNINQSKYYHCVYNHVDFKDYIVEVDTITHKYAPIPSVSRFIKSFNIHLNEVVYVYDKKKFLHFIEKYGVKDLFDKIIDVRYIEGNYNIYNNDVLNTQLSEMPIFNLLKKIENHVSKFINNDKHLYTISQNKFYNDIVIPSLYSIEKNKFINCDFDNNSLINNKMVNSEYQIFNRTRPFSKYVTKDYLIRSKYRENGTLIEIDIESAVLQYMAKIMLNDFVFGTNPIFYLQNYIPFLFYSDEKKIIKDFYNRLIFDSNILNASDLNVKIKKNKFIDELLYQKKILYSEFKHKGYLLSPISGIKIHNMTEQNYMSLLYQIIETELNMLIIDKFNKVLKYDDRIIDKRNNIILYKYDSFVFDFSKEEFQTMQVDYKLSIFKTILNDELKLNYSINGCKDLYKNFKKQK